MTCTSLWTDLHQHARAMQDDEQVEERVGVVGEPEEAEKVSAAEVSEHVDDGGVEGEEDASEASDGLPAPVVELGQHVGPAGISTH